MSLAIEVYKCLHNIAPEYQSTLLAKHNVPYEINDKYSVKFMRDSHASYTLYFLDYKIMVVNLYNMIFNENVNSSLDIYNDNKLISMSI